MTQKTLLDPRQALATSLYRDPTSKTFGNLEQSLVEAGFSKKYARKVDSNKIQWLVQAKDTVDMIEQAEKNLRAVNGYAIDFNKHTKSNVDMIKLQTDVAKFILKTLGKKKYNDHDEKEQKGNVTINITNYNDPEPKAVREAEEVQNLINP